MAEEAPREIYGKTLVELGSQNPDIVVLDADLSKSTQTQYFGARFPERFFNIGIAEQNMIGIAAGLASSGKIPFASTFAVFAPGRCFDQIRMSVAQPKHNVKIVTTHGGITVGEDGVTHQAIEDLSLICSLPGMTVIVPADAVETAQVIKFAASYIGPVYVRLPRLKIPVIFDANYKFELGKAALLRQGTDATIAAIGTMVAPALEAADILQKDNISCRVLNMSSLQPLDEAAIIQAARDTGAIITAEEHLKHGGLNSTVSQIICQNIPVPVESVALLNYAQSGKPAELLQRYGLTSPDIVLAVKKAVRRK
jgi:transketolase